MFSTRFGSEGRIYQGKVQISNIRAYMESESEVLVFPEDVEFIEEL